MFQKRLNELLKINNMFQSDLGKYVGYTPQAIGKWCRGETEPDLKTLIKIANFFNVSVDYLIGNDNKFSKNNIKIENIEKEVLRKALVNAGYMKNNEDISEKELNRLMEFVVNNKKFIEKK